MDAEEIANLYRGFLLRSGKLAAPQGASELWWQGIKSVLAEGEAEVALPLELEGDPWLAVAVSDALTLARMADDEIEIRSVGRPRGAYVERLRLGEHGLEETFEIEDESIPSTRLVVTIQPEPSVRAESSQFGLAERAAQVELRNVFRRWVRERGYSDMTG